MESLKPNENGSFNKENTPPNSEALPVRAPQPIRYTTLTPAKQAVKAALRTHAFQLLRMQNEVQSLKTQLSELLEDKQKQASNMKTLYLQMAELKGLVARLTMEGDMPNTTKQQPPHEIKTENQEKYGLNDVEKFADAFLQQQRTSLISCLVR